jgi:hypothetical protein
LQLIQTGVFFPGTLAPSVGRKGYVLNDDTTTLETIRKFLASEKPTCITPVDILQMIHFISRKAEDHDIFDSQQTLARMFSADARTIQRSQERLASPEIDWIARPHRRGKTNAIAIKYENVPAEEILRLKITDEAKQISLRYQQALKRLRKKFPAHWLPQQFPSAQRILNECDGDVELAARLIGHALSHPAHAAKSRQSLYHLYGRWKRILETYSAQLQAQEQARQQTEVTIQ